MFHIVSDQRQNAFDSVERWMFKKMEERRKKKEREKKKRGVKREREILKTQRRDGRRLLSDREMKAEGAWGITMVRDGEGKGTNAGSTFIHKTKAESDKERIVSASGTRTIIGSTNALASSRARNTRNTSHWVAITRTNYM